jgi:serine/threonine-protein kinase
MKTCPVCDTPFPDQHATCPTDGAVLIELQELEPGHIVRGKYRIARKLGAGGMGIVYLGEHLMLGGQVALKFLAAELSRNPKFIKRFRREARASYQLRDPNIVEVIDLDQDEDGSLFIAMEYVNGPSLRSVLDEARHGLPIKRALHIACGIAAGLAAAHARGAIHRDIKPENILLGTQPDGREQPKVLDFGIAAMTEGITNLSNTRGLLLTPEYAAPEQWRGTRAEELDGRTDLYALGGVLYEMLAGRTPYYAENMEGWMYQHLQGTPPPLELLRPELAREHPGLEAIVMRLLAREREQRFPSAAAVVEALSAPPPPPRPKTLAEAPAPPPPAPVSEPKPKQRRSGSRVWVIAAILMGICLGVWAGLRYLPPLLVTETPVLRPEGDTYAEAQAVTITDATPFAVIHYTVDGSTPTEASPVYTQPIAGLPSGSKIRAIATAVGRAPSSEVSGVYTWASAKLLAAKPPEPSAYDQGKAAYKSEQYAQARLLFAQACKDGVNDACNYLGYIYAQGLGGKPDVDAARKIYQKACEQGNLLSCTSLGTLYQNDKKYAEARNYFKQACDGETFDACNYLGYLYAQGLGGPQDKQKAREIYQKACDQKNLSSCTSLGTMYQDDHKYAEARTYFKQACDGGVKDACELLRGLQ